MIGISNACFRALLSALLVGLTADAALAQGPDPVRFGNAMELGDVRSARRWLDEGLPPDFEGERLGSGLMIGAWEGNIALMELFLQRGADVNHISRFGEQALQLAAWRGHIDAVRWLLARGAVLQRPGKHWNALHYAAFAGHGDIMSLLMERGADLEARTPNDSTALMLAAREGHEALAQQLLAAGADPRAANDWGYTAYTWALKYGRQRLAQQLLPPEGAPEMPKTLSADPPQRSEPAPPEVAALAQSLQRLPTDDAGREALHQALTAAIAQQRLSDAAAPAETSTSPRRGVPQALVITASRSRPGRERVAVIYPPGAPSDAAEVARALDALRQAQSQGRPVAQLRRELMQAVSRFKSAAPATPDAR